MYSQHYIIIMVLFISCAVSTVQSWVGSQSVTIHGMELLQQQLVSAVSQFLK